MTPVSQGNLNTWAVIARTALCSSQKGFPSLMFAFSYSVITVPITGEKFKAQEGSGRLKVPRVGQEPGFQPPLWLVGSYLLGDEASGRPRKQEPPPMATPVAGKLRPQVERRFRGCIFLSWLLARTRIRQGFLQGGRLQFKGVGTSRTPRSNSPTPADLQFNSILTLFTWR